RRVPPAQQRLGADRVAVDEVEDRLVHQVQLAPGDHAGEVLLQRHPAEQGGFQRLVVPLDAAPPPVPRPAQRERGPAQRVAGPGVATANSSAARRAGTSAGSTPSRSRRAASTSTASPTSGPRTSLTAVKPSRSITSTAPPGVGAPRSPATVCRSCRRLARPVS